jgi:hypothetical protein
VHGYAATARIEHAQPHRASIDREAEPTADATLMIDVESVEIAGRPLGERWHAWWTEVRATWEQTTFFLFDPESWR